MIADIASLVAGALAREPEAWGTIVDGYGPVVWGTLRKFTSLSEQERRDLFQDVFVVLLDRGLSSFRGSSDHEFRWYLRAIAQNEARSLLRRHGRRFETLDPLLLDVGADERSPDARVWQPVDPSPGPEEVAVESQALRSSQKCFEELSVTDQQLFWMRTRGWSYEDIATCLVVPMGTVASKYHRAKVKLEECLRRAGIV
jgi:RNA polymerase sigma-70 factor, ECF subfamily